MIERKFLEDAIKNLEIEDFLKKNLDKADYSHTDIKITPMSTRLVVYVGRPGIAIGKAGKNIEVLTDGLRTKFDIKNPQLDIKLVDEPDLDAKLVAKRIAGALERGMKSKRVAGLQLKNIMRAGAVGAEIRMSGKMAGERSKSEKIGFGFLKKCGAMVDIYVDRGYAVAKLKPGTMGIKVRIMPKMPPAAVLEEKSKQAATAELKKTEKEELENEELEAPETEKKAEPVKEEEAKAEKGVKAEKVHKEHPKAHAEEKHAKPEEAEKKAEPEDKEEKTGAEAKKEQE